MLDATMSLDSAEFRRVLGHWASGVAVVTTQQGDGRPCGLTANAISSLSLDPPLVLTCVEKTADTHDCIVSNRFFAISVLAEDGERLARRFAAPGLDNKFDGVAFREESTGAPVLEDALAWVDCRLHAQYDGGDHSIFVGHVMAGGARDAGALLYYRSGYGRFTP
jgi:flavin reductase (DIM6/NTAB) family NADH-FMN oxidoreductase RutF